VLAVEGAHDFVRWPVEIETPGGPIIALRPVPLSLSMLDPIICAEAAGELDYASQETFSPQLGDVVTVKSGKWKGFLGRIVALSKRKMTIAGERGSIGKLQIEPEHLSQAPDEQYLAA
jgi:transcription antitermination factor NusG